MLRVALRIFLAFAGVFALDAVLFRTNLYPSIMEPNSAAGQVRNLLLNEAERKITGPNQVLAVGDSRMHLMPRIANELTGETGYTFASIAIGGSTLRGWYYMLRDTNPGAGKYAAILIPVESYDDQDRAQERADWELDLYYMIDCLRLTDLFVFPASFKSRERRWEAYRGLLFKGLVYKRDVQEFLRAPARRLDYVATVRRNSARWIYKYQGPNRNLAGLTIDWTTRTAHFPNGLPEAQRKSISNVLLAPPPPHTGAMASYQREWLGRIRSLYRGTRTKIIILRLARAPIVEPASVPADLHSSIRELAGQPDVIVLNEHLFDELERPDLFLDARHLNGEGATRFSHSLAREVRKVLGPPQS